MNSLLNVRLTIVFRRNDTLCSYLQSCEQSIKLPFNVDSGSDDWNVITNDLQLISLRTYLFRTFLFPHWPRINVWIIVGGSFAFRVANYYPRTFSLALLIFSAINHSQPRPAYDVQTTVVSPLSAQIIRLCLVLEEESIHVVWHTEQSRVTAKSYAYS